MWSRSLAQTAVQSLARRTLAIMLAVDLAVFLRYAIADWPKPWLRLLGEQNTITWLSTIQLSLIGWLALAIAVVSGGAGWRHRWQQVAWTGLGLTFLLLSADEFLCIHESQSLRIPGLAAGEGLLMVIALAGGSAALVLLVPLLRSLPVSRRLFTGACVAAAASQVVDIPDLEARGFGMAWGKALEMSEEALELMAEAGFVAALLSLLAMQVVRLLVPGKAAAVPALGSLAPTPSPAPQPPKPSATRRPTRRPVALRKTPANTVAEPVRSGRW